MYAFTFRIDPEKDAQKGAGRGKKQQAVRLAAGGMDEKASFAGNKKPPSWLAKAARFSFETPFAPRQLYDALSRSGLSFELETDCPESILAEAADEPADAVGSLVRKTLLGHCAVLTRQDHDPGARCFISVLNNEGEPDYEDLFIAQDRKTARRVHDRVVQNIRSGRPADDGTQELIEGFSVLPAAAEEPEKPAGDPAWLKSVYDVLDGRYDGSLPEMQRIITAAQREIVKTDFDFGRFAAVHKALHHSISLRQQLQKPSAKPAPRPEAGSVPDCVLVLYDILDSRYDEDAEEMLKLLRRTLEELAGFDFNQGWNDLARQASQHVIEHAAATENAVFDVLCACKTGEKPDKRLAEGCAPDWVLPLYDILDGRYDEDADAMRRVLAAAEEKTALPDCHPAWQHLACLAARHLAQLVQAQEASVPGSSKARKKAETDGAPDWVLSLYDILDGRYDEDPARMLDLLKAAANEACRQDCDPRWAQVFHMAAKHQEQLQAPEEECCGQNSDPDEDDLPPDPDCMQAVLDLIPGCSLDKPAAKPVTTKKAAPKTAAPGSGLKLVEAHPEAGSRPDWLAPLFDIIVGDYDDAPLQMIRLIKTAAEEAGKPGCRPGWKKVVDLAWDHLSEILSERGFGKPED